VLPLPPLLAASCVPKLDLKLHLPSAVATTLLTSVPNMLQGVEGVTRQGNKLTAHTLKCCVPFGFTSSTIC
jgi:hypothetical protein